MCGVKMKFNPDDIIKLALANPGYGFKRFMGVLTGSESRTRGHSQILRLFDLHHKETGVNPYDVLQDSSELEMVTMKEYTEVTGKSAPPVGFGRGHGGRIPKPKRKTPMDEVRQRLVPLPPQTFNYLDVPESGSINTYSGQGQTNHLMLIDIKRYMNLKNVEMRTEEQISSDLDVSKNWLMRFDSNLNLYDEEGILDDWVRVFGLMYEIQQFRGMTYKNDELMADFRGIFRDYLHEPIGKEPPTNEDLVWVFNQLSQEQGFPLFIPAE
jgi:hypothetical protein